VQKRINNKSVIDAIHNMSERKCEYVDPQIGQRCNKPVLGEPHHIKSRGAGGDDIIENEIDLCGECHTKAHNGQIKRQTLIQIVAEREAITYEEVCQKTRLFPKEEPQPTQKQEEPTMAELISAYIQLEEQEKDVRWIKGQLLDSMINAGAKQSWIASQVGVSGSQLRELVKTYKAFPQESMRIPSLSWYHHRVAANSPDPAKYIQEAADNDMSTREMRKKILEEEGAVDLIQMEEAEEKKKAEKVLSEVEKVIAKGGDAARLLKAGLARLIQEGVA
jgi:hypothetical protein